MEVRGKSALLSGHFSYKKKTSSIDWIEVRVGPRVSLDMVVNRNILAPRGNLTELSQMSM
jgi:hypothetical protein